jgi:hypothetical protein
MLEAVAWAFVACFGFFSAVALIAEDPAWTPIALAFLVTALFLRSKGYEFDDDEE